MNKIILSSLFTLSLVYANGIPLNKSIKDKIVILDNEKEYQTARELLSDFITNDNKLDSLKFWLEQDKKILQNLYFNDNHITSLYFKKNKAFNKLLNYYTEKSILSVALGAPTIIELYNIYQEKNAYQIYKKETKQYLLNYHIDLINIKNAKKILKQFDILKKSQEKLNYILKEYIKQANPQEFKKILPLLKEVKSFKNEIKIKRVNFISYTVISPYLADAQRYIILSNLDELMGHNEEYLKKATKSMAKGAYNDILLESNEDVRDHFYTVFQKLKETAGEKEWEDLKVLQTLMDSSSNAKKTGADRWWE